MIITWEHYYKNGNKINIKQTLTEVGIGATIDFILNAPGFMLANVTWTSEYNENQILNFLTPHRAVKQDDDGAAVAAEYAAYEKVKLIEEIREKRTKWLAECVHLGQQHRRIVASGGTPDFIIDNVHAKAEELSNMTNGNNEELHNNVVKLNQFNESCYEVDGEYHNLDCAVNLDKAIITYRFKAEIDGLTMAECCSSNWIIV